jgi:hypothetical protein
MKNKRLYTLFTISVVFIFVFSLFSTINVLADDMTPPAATDVPVVPVATDVPTATAAPAATNPPAATDVPTATSVPTATDAPAATEVPTATDAPAQDITVAEAQAQLPAGADLVVVDSNGNALPLVSADAASALTSADPYFFDGTDYIGFTSGASCPAIVTVCNTGTSTPIQDAVDAFGASGTATGNIYVEADTYTENVVIDGTVNSGYLTNLTGIIGDGSGSTILDGSFEIFNMNAFTLSGFNIYDGGSGGGYVYAHDNSGTLTLKDLVVSNSGANNGPNGNGIEVVSHTGDINLTSVNSSDNYNDGAYLDNVSGTGKISVTDSTFNNNGQTNDGRGLIAHSNSDITLTDVTANDNGGGGAELINCFFNFSGSQCDNTNPATITLNGTNTFIGNGYNPPSSNPLGSFPASVGLWAGSNSDVSLSGVTADQNGMGFLGGGAFVFTHGGNLSITNSNFNENCMACGLGFGFAALNLGGDITLNGVTADGTGNQALSAPSEGIGGLILNLSGNTFVNNSDFSNNCTNGNCSGAGIFILSAAGDVTLDHVTANGNGIGGGVGAIIGSGGNIDITCSTFNNNFGDGLDANMSGTSGTMTLNGVALNGNTIKPLDFAGGTLVQNPFDCNGSGKKLFGLPLNIVHVTNGQSVELDCEHFSGTKLVLENGDSVILPCPLSDSASLKDEAKDGLSAPLPDGGVFQSAFTTAVSEKGENKSKLSTSAIISFVIPAGADASKLSILFWDGAKWIEVGASATGDGHFEASVNYTGTFVLVSK